MKIEQAVFFKLVDDVAARFSRLAFLLLLAAAFYRLSKDENMPDWFVWQAFVYSFVLGAFALLQFCAVIEPLVSGVERSSTRMLRVIAFTALLAFVLMMKLYILGVLVSLVYPEMASALI